MMTEEDIKSAFEQDKKFEKMAESILKKDSVKGKRNKDRAQIEFISSVAKLHELSLNKTSCTNPYLIRYMVDIAICHIIIDAIQKKDKNLLKNSLLFSQIFLDTIRNSFGNDLEAHNKSNRYGIFIFALILYGSPQGAAYRLTEKLSNKKVNEKTAEKYYRDFIGRKDWLKAFESNDKKTLFVLMHMPDLISILDSFNQEPFRALNKYDAKALESYNTIKREISILSEDEMNRIGLIERPYLWEINENIGTMLNFILNINEDFFPKENKF